MHSDLYELCATVRDGMAVPPFPRASIHASVANAAPPRRRKYVMPALVATGALLAMAAAAEVATQTHIGFTPSGGMVIESPLNGGSRAISSDAEIKEAASHLNFRAVLPAGLPEGTKATRLESLGSDAMVVYYDLPGAWRASHHLAWIFLANPATLGNQSSSPARYSLRSGGRMSQAHWRVGAEEVIVVSNGLTAGEIDTIKQAMQREAPL